MKKSTKSKSGVVKAHADQDVVGLITTLVEKLVSLEAKMDTLLSRCSQRPVEAPRQHVQAPVAQQQRDVRHMHKAICADCRKECEVPFKPAGDRPVYCKECFAKRRNSGTFKPWGNEKPKHGPAAVAQVPEKPAVAHAKPAAKKKAAASKKTKRK